MSESKTAPASPRVLAQARARGDIPYASEWPFSCACLALLASLAHVGGDFVSDLQRLARSAWGLQPGDTGVTGVEAWIGIAQQSLLLVTLTGTGLMLAVMAQRAPMLFGFSVRQRTNGSVVRTQRPRQLAWSLVELSVLAVVLTIQLKGSLSGVLEAYRWDASELSYLIWSTGRALTRVSALVLVGLGAGGLWLQSRERSARLRMTPRQVREEQRELAGDPRLLAELRRNARTGAAHGVHGADDAHGANPAQGVQTAISKGAGS